MAESKGFEPLVGSLLHFFSKEALSTTQPTLLDAIRCVNQTLSTRSLIKA